LRGEAVVHLAPKELAALRLLIAHAGQIVTPLQLKQALWGDVHVTADSVPKCLSSLRARLEPEKCIQTVYKRGYRLSVEVRRELPERLAALPRLAIMPFDTGYTVPEHLGSAIADETVARLVGVRPPFVSVLARDSVFTLAQRGLSAQQVGETLNADLVLTGTLRTLPAHFRLRAEMIQVRDGTQIWVEDLLIPQTRIAGLEMELVERLAFRLNSGDPGDRSSSQWWKTGVPGDRSLLQGWKTGDPGDRNLRRHVVAPGTKNPDPKEGALASWGGGGNSSSLAWPTTGLSISAAAAHAAASENESQRREAYEIFQRARYEWRTLERHRMQDGLQHLARATELDPSLIAAKVDLVHLCVTQANYGFMSPSVAADLVRRTVQSIPDLSRESEAILPALGWINFHVDFNLPAAISAFSSSAHLPHDPWTTRVRVQFALSRRRFDEALGLLRAALREDPYSPWLHSRLAWAHHLAGQAAESLEQMRHALALFPEHDGTSLFGAMILAFNGETARAAELAHDLSERLPYFDLAMFLHAYTLACIGRDAEARAILERLQWLGRERFVLSSFASAVHVALGDQQSAIAGLRAAEEARCPWFFQLLADPRLEPLHNHPEFDRMSAILTRMEADAAQNAASGT
jgi:TolB-like protein